MSLWSRVVNAWTGAVNGWNGDAFNPIDLGEWDTFAARQLRYETNEAYYNNTVYDTLSSTAGQLKARGDLYKFIRGVRNPVARLIAVYVAKVYGGSLDLQTGKAGAIPLSCDDALALAIVQLWKTSNWNTNKSLFVQKGSLLGDSFLKLVNEPEYEAVCMELVHPVKVREFEKDSKGDFTRVVLEYDVVADTTDKNNRYRYKEIITKEAFEFFKDDRPFDYVNNVAGGQYASYPNVYGFVPMAQAQHNNVGLDSGASAFQMSITKINELNDAASLLNDQIRKAVQTNWVFAGAKRGDVDLTNSARDKGGFIYASSQATVTPLVFPLDIAGAIANIQQMENEIEYDMPELALYRVRAVGLASGVAVKRMYDDAVARIKGGASNFDDALARAQSMGVAMGAYHRYKGYEAFTLESYKRGDLYHVIKEREMFDESLDRQTRLTILGTLKDDPPAIARLKLQEMDYDKQTIDEVVNELEEKEVEAQAAAAASFGRTMFGEDYGTTGNQSQPRGGGNSQTREQQDAEETRASAETSRPSGGQS